MEKIHTTNYFKTFVECAEDCPALHSEEPPLKNEDKSIARLQYEMLRSAPYKFTSDEILFSIHALRKDLAKSELKEEKEKFFSKGQACLRSSPLAKRYGWGFHFDEAGKVAMIGREDDAYEKFKKNKALKVVKAMRSARK